jgi:hypothetical protein
MCCSSIEKRESFEFLLTLMEHEVMRSKKFNPEVKVDITEGSCTKIGR